MILQVVVDLYRTNQPPNLHEDFLQDLEIVAMVRYGEKKHDCSHANITGQPTLLLTWTQK